MKLVCEHIDQVTQRYHVVPDDYMAQPNEMFIGDLTKIYSKGRDLIGTISGYQTFIAWIELMRSAFHDQLAINSIDEITQGKWDGTDITECLNSDEERSIVAHLLLVPNKYLLQIPNTDFNYWLDQRQAHEKLIKEGRKKILTHIISCLQQVCMTRFAFQSILTEMNLLPKDSAIGITLGVLDTNVISFNLLANYIEFGYEGTIENDPDENILGIKDFIDSRVGTAFEGAGIRHRDNAELDIDNIPYNNWGEVADALLLYFDEQW